MDALLVSTLFGLGLLFVFDGLVRPHLTTGATRRLRTLGPRSLAGAVGVALGYLVTGWPIAALAAGVVAAAVPEMIRRSREDRARLERREAIAEVSSRLRDAIRSGIGLADALANVAERPRRGSARTFGASSRTPGSRVSAKRPAPSPIECPIPPRTCSRPRS